MITVQHAYELRTVMEERAQTLSDEIALTVPEMFPRWSDTSTYAIGDRVRYDGQLYKCVQANEANGAYTPDVSVSLWAKVLTDPAGEVLPWVQPDSTNPYMMGDRVSYNGHIYESIQDYNVFAPDVAGWVVVE